MFHSIYILVCLATHLLKDFELFPRFAITNKAAVDICVQGFSCEYKILFLWDKYPGVQLLGYVIVKKLQNSFQSCTILHSHQLCMSDPVSLNICLTLVV